MKKLIEINNQQEADKEEAKNYWEDYNKRLKNNGTKVIHYENGKKISAKSYTHLHSKKFNLTQYLNSHGSKIIQFGASTGRFLFQNKDKYRVMGYDYSSHAIEVLNKENIPCRQVDLNDIAATKAYLKQDIDSSEMNFIAIKIFQYLEEKPLIALIFTLFNAAPSGSCFVIANSIREKCHHQTLTKNYIASFFGARTDMKFLLMAQTLEKSKDASDKRHNDNEILVAQKF